MKLSASINFFNCEELLLHTVKSIRPLVEHLSIVYQKNSNYNEPITEEALNLIKYLQHSNLVDDIVLYEPNLTISASSNEFQKRSIGLKLAIQNNASHFLLMDADEFYEKKKFLNAKKYIKQNNISGSCVNSYFYIQKPIYRSEFIDTTNVCFITKIDSNLSFSLGQNYPINNVDPTRRLVNLGGDFILLNPKSIVMHHMNFVRNNYDSKLKNTSSAVDTQFVNNARHSLESWKWGEKLFFPNKPPYNIIKVENTFNINLDETKYSLNF